METIAQRFELRGPLGRGGMGEVYLALDLRDNRLVALKTLHHVEAASLFRLKQEFRALADIDHPNLVRLHELFVDPERHDVFWCFFTMEYVPGQHLLDRLRHRPEPTRASVTWSGDDAPPTPVQIPSPETQLATVDLVEVASAFGQLAAAVEVLHRHGKLHRDLKSANVLLDPSGRVVVLDFGLVRPAGPVVSEHIAGTPRAMSPEQMRGEPEGAASDWYSVGVLLYEALNGRAPFGGDFVSMARAKWAGAHRPIGAGVDPAWAGLCAALLHPEPELRAGFEAIQALTHTPVWETGPEAVDQALVGRATERDVLRSAWARVCAGQAGAVFIQGRSGIGKSALVRDLAEELARDPANLVLTGRCHEREQVPHKALDAMIDALSHHLEGLRPDELAPLVPAHAPALARLFPVLGRHPAFLVDEAVPADPRAARALGAVALEDLLRRVATRWHVFIWLDDLQWGDSDSAALITRVLRAAAPPVVLLVGSHRDEDSANSPMLQALAPLRQGRGIVNVSLGPLTDADARALLRTAGVQPDEALIAEAGGDPYLLAEAAMWLPTSRRFTGIPEMLRARLESVPSAVRELVEAAAVAGRPTPLSFLPTSTADRRGDLRIATQLRLLRLHGAPEEGRVDCYHDQVRGAALAELDPERCRALHAGLADAIEAGDPDPEALSLHLEGAGQPARAAQYALQAAAAAEEALAFRHAAGLYARYLDLAPPDSPRAEAELRRAENLAQAGEGRAAADAFLTAARGHAAANIALRTRAAQELMMSGHLDAGLALAAEVLAAVGLRFHRSQIEAVVATLWNRLRVRWRGLVPGTTPPTAEELQRLDTCWAMVTGLHSVDPLRASAYQTRFMLMALDAGEPRRIARGFAAEAASMSIGGERKLQAGLALAARAQALAEELDDPQLLALTAQERGTLYFMCGHWRQAEIEFRSALARLAADCPGAVWQRSTSELFLMDQYIYLGDMDRIAESADRLLRDGTASGNLYQLTIAMRPLHIVRLAADDPETAFREVDEAIGMWPGEGRVQHFNANWALGQTELYAGRGEAALARVVALWSVLRRAMLLTMEYIRIEMLHLRGRALLASAAGGERQKRLAAAEKDANRLLTEVAPWARPLGLLVRGAVRKARGDTPEDDLVAALASFEEQGMAMYAAATRRRLAELRGDPSAVEGAFVGLRVVNPARMTEMLAPGL